ncbi:MAG TPA: twin transmembrane helix small protein [Sphingobium sp.]
MNAFLVILIILAALATVFMLVRGIVTFLKTTEAELNSTDAGPSPSSLKQNKAMMGRILFQALAILFAALLLLLNSGK